MKTFAKRPRDANQLAKAVVDIAVGDAEDETEVTGKAVGGHARAAVLPPERRREIALMGVAARRKAGAKGA